MQRGAIERLGRQEKECVDVTRQGCLKDDLIRREREREREMCI